MPIRSFAIVRPSETAQMVSAQPDNPIPGYILRVMREEGWRAVDVLDNAKALKLKLKQATFSEVYSGQTKNPGIFTLIKISKALKRPFEEMVAEIQGSGSANSDTFKESEFAVLLEMYERLAAKDKKIADRLMDMLKREFSELLSSNVRQM